MFTLSHVYLHAFLSLMDTRCARNQHVGRPVYHMKRQFLLMRLNRTDGRHGFEYSLHATFVLSSFFTVYSFLIIVSFFPNDTVSF